MAWQLPGNQAPQVRATRAADQPSWQQQWLRCAAGAFSNDLVGALRHTDVRGSEEWANRPIPRRRSNYQVCYTISMAKDFSFDVVSDFDPGEMTNAVDQAQRELSQRYDFKGTAAKLEFAEAKTGVQLEGDSRNQIDAIIDVLQGKLIKRNISPKTLDLSSEPVESGMIVKYAVPFKKGLDQEKAKKLTKLIRETYPKAKTQIQGEEVRISSTSKDDLQGIMAHLKAQELDFPLVFRNFR